MPRDVLEPTGNEGSVLRGMAATAEKIAGAVGSLAGPSSTALADHDRPGASVVFETNGPTAERSSSGGSRPASRPVAPPCGRSTGSAGPYRHSGDDLAERR